jgi:von Willebrand factor type D domain
MICKQHDMNRDFFFKHRTRVDLPYVDQRGGGFSIVERLFGSHGVGRSGRVHTDADDQQVGNGLRVIVLTTSVGLQVIWDGGSYLELSVPPKYRNRMCGLCGESTHFQCLFPVRPYTYRSVVRYAPTFRASFSANDAGVGGLPSETLRTSSV